jgi:ubiquinone/menaquinone biosynthesis C-methylase UbiE
MPESAPSKSKKEYTFGHSSSATATHAARTVRSDAAFLLPYIKPTDRILDVGCGPGTITFGFAEYVPEGSVTGTDYTPVIVQKAQEFLLSKMSEDDGKSRGKVDFVLGNVLERLPFEDETFDVIFSSQVLTHLGNESIPALKEMRRVLKTGGVLSSRDGAIMHYHPPHFELDRLFWGNICKAADLDGWTGPKMAAFYRATGFDVDGGKVKVGTGSNVITGSEATRFHAESMAGRMKKGDAFRANWEKAGISQEEIERCAEAFRQWGETEDAWSGILQSEIVAWK